MTTCDSSTHNYHVTSRALLGIHPDRVTMHVKPQRRELDSNRHNPLLFTASGRAARSIRIVCIVLILFMACAGSDRLRAQSTFGTILGTVQDTSGAVIPGAIITAHSLDENADHATTSSSSGEFVFENLKAGHYKVTVQKEGFTDSVVSSATLEARQQLRLPVTLSVTAGITTVEISADAALMNTENGTLNNTISSEDITQLPVNSRSVSSSPLGALAVSPEVTRGSQGGIAVGGATAAQTGFSVDGISTANVRFNGSLQDTYPSLESIDEMKVTAFNNDAEFAQIGDVTFTTKSGTNKWSGSAFEYFQNSALDATVLNFPVKAPRTFNTFGGSLGGPVTIPETSAQTSHRVAESRLTQPDTFRGAPNVPLVHQRFKGEQQIEIDAAYIHYVNNIDSNYRLYKY